MKRLFLSLPVLFFFLHSGCTRAPQLPAIQIVKLNDLESLLAKHQGKGLLLNFWAIWCEPCVEELPHLVEIARDYRDRGGVVLGISYDLMVPAVTREGVLSQMHDFVLKRRLDIPVLIYDGPDYDAINDRFNLPGPIPCTVAINRTGKIVDHQEGQAGKSRFAEMMRKALEQ